MMINPLSFFKFIKLSVVVKIVIIIVVITSISGGAFYILRQADKSGEGAENVFDTEAQKNFGLDDSPSITFAPTAAAIPSPRHGAIGTDAFQVHLTEKCKRIESSAGGVGSNGSFFYGIDASELPIQINTKVIPVRLREQNTVVCMMSGPNTHYLIVEFGQGSKMYIYNDKSVELVEGGQAMLAFSGIPIEELGDQKIGVYLSLPSAGPAYVDQLAVVARGYKTMKSSGGVEFYAVVDNTLMQEGDPRLATFLLNYAKKSVFDPDKYELSGDPKGVEKEVVNRFFSTTSVIGEPEKTALANLKAVLTNIAPK